MQGPQKIQSTVRMVLYRRTLSRATIATFVMLVMMVVMCHGQAEEVLIPLENTTAILGEKGHFFCQIQADIEHIRFNGVKYAPPRNAPKDVTVTPTRLPAEQNDLRIINVTITIEASIERNNTLVECIAKNDRSNATLTVQGAPAKPDVSYEVQQKEILLSWPRPFTWKDYNITQYHTVCRDANNMKIYENYIENTANKAVINQTVDVVHDVSDCYAVKCNVTASNALDESAPSVTVVSFPRAVTESPSVSVIKDRFTADKKPEVHFCLKLPVLCPFQNVTYTIVISHEGDEVYRVSKEFSYSSGYNGECIEELVSDGLEEGKEYRVQVTVDAGESGRSTSVMEEPLKLELRVGDENFIKTRSGIISIIIVGTVLVVLLGILVTIIIVSYRKRGRAQSSKPPLKRTITPMVNNPIYGGDRSPPLYEQVRPPHLQRFNSTPSHSNLDSPLSHMTSPVHSSLSHIPVSPHHIINNIPRSPGSPHSNTLFTWPYSTIQHTDPAMFDAIEADVENAARQAAAREPRPPSTPGEDSYMTMSAVTKPKDVNIRNDQGHPRYAIDIHGNRYIEC